METESADLDPRDHLRQLDAAATSARRETHHRTPLWFWPTLALLAPLVVFVRSTSGVARVALVVACAVPILTAMVIEWRQERHKRSRGRTGWDQGPGTLWRFLGLFSFILGLQMAGGLLSVDEPVRTAVFTYLFIALPCTFFFWKFDTRRAKSTVLRGDVS